MKILLVNLKKKNTFIPFSVFKTLYLGKYYSAALTFKCRGSTAAGLVINGHIFNILN